MLASALSALSDRLDFSFLTAFWLPACVAVFGAAGIWSLGAGWDVAASGLDDLDSVTQAFLALIVLLGITLLAFILRALARPIAATFAGDMLPKQAEVWMRGQQVAKHRAEQRRRAAAPDGRQLSRHGRVERRAARQTPHAHDDFRATRIGNLMEVANEHPRLAYAMEGLFWWPRLATVAPDAFHNTLAGVQSPMMALLNLSLVFVGLALTAGAAVVLAHLPLTWAVVIILVGLGLSNACYRAAVSQAAELSSLLCVGFDLYRHDILRMMDIAVPDDLADERTLWISLTNEVLALGPQAASTPASGDGGDPLPELGAPDEAAADVPDAGERAAEPEGGSA